MLRAGWPSGSGSGSQSCERRFDSSSRLGERLGEPDRVERARPGAVPGGCVMRTLFVATVGGHLAQLVEIAGRLPGGGDDVAIWATSDNAQSRSLLDGKAVEFIPHVGPKDVRGVVRAVPIARRLHREYHFDRVISTGSATAVGYLPYLAARGVRAHYIESSTRIAGMSTSGRILNAIPGINLYTQYEHRVEGRWHYAGWVYDRYTAHRLPDTPMIRRAVVSLGTSPGFEFRRMLDALEPLLRPGGMLEQKQGEPVETLWQTGCTPDGLDLDARQWVAAEDMETAIAAADVVISHAGTGSALSAMNAGRLPVLIPRDETRGEVGDGHQQLFAAELQKRGVAIACPPEALNVDDLLYAASYRVEAATTPPPFQLRP